MSNDEAVVAVFGDLGRSPRMINHARELLKSGYNVDLIGYAGGRIHQNKLLIHVLEIDEDILTSDGVKLHFVNSFNFDFVKKNKNFFDKYFKIILVAVRLILLSINLVLIFSSVFFARKKSPKIMIIQV